MPPRPNIRRFAHTWTFGTRHSDGYHVVCHKGKTYMVHRIICRAFNGLAPEGKPFVDHINRIRHDNRPSNLRWVSAKENSGNQAKVDVSIEKYGTRFCDDSSAYMKAYVPRHREEVNARQRVYDATKRAKMKAQGLIHKKGPDGKWGWYPRIRTKTAI